MRAKPPRDLIAMPPDAGQNCAADVRRDIPDIARRATQQMRPDHFKKNRPHDQVKRDLSARGKFVMLPQAKPALHQQQRRQRTGHQEQVIEMKTEECAVNVRTDQPTIDSIKQTANQEQRIAEIAEPFHSSAKIVQPKAVASSSLKRRTMLYFASSSKTRQNYSGAEGNSGVIKSG